MMSSRLGRDAAKPAVVAAVILVLLSGCSGPVSEPEPEFTPGVELEAAPGWVEPGWMTQVRQDDEEFQSAMISCYAEFGLTGVRTIGGGGVGFLDLPSENGQLTPEIEAVLEEASAECNARVPLPEHQGAVADDEAYGRMLSLRDCIIAYGYDVPEAPSAETWKDTPVSGIWNPYSAMFSDGSSLPQDELRSLMAACPQSGPGNYAEAPTDGGE